MSRRGMTMVEVVVATALVGVVLVAALNTVGSSRRSLQGMQDRGRAVLLAQQLMSEILAQPFKDPDIVTVTLGPEVNEILVANRSLFDDVDDYKGYTCSPPELKDGTVLSDLGKWRLTVDVSWVSAANLSVVSLTATGVKRIKVTASISGVDVSSLTAIRTNGWPDTAALRSP